MNHRLTGPCAALALAFLAAPASLRAAASFCARTDVRLPTPSAHSLVMADFYPGNGPDLAITFGQSAKLSLWENDGTGTFTERDVLTRPNPDSVFTSLVSDPAAIIAADFDEDGRIDIAGTNRTQTRYFAYLNPGVPGAWSAADFAATDARRGDGNAMVAVGWNSDRALDLVVGQDAGAISIALGAVDGGGNPTGTWGTVQRFNTTAAVGVFTDVEVANFVDRPAETGTPDVLAVDNQYHQLVVWPGDPLRPGFVLSDPASLVLIPVRDASGAELEPVDAVLGNWNRDAWPDVLVSTTKGVVLYFQGNGTASVFAAPVRQDFVAGLGIGARMPSDWSAMKYVEVTGDAIRDLVVADAGETSSDRGFNWLTIIPGVTDEPSAPTFDVAAQQHHAMGNMSSLRPGSVAVGDIDGDGDNDIVVLHGDQASLSVLRNDGAGNFDAPRSYTAGATEPHGAAGGQVDADAPEELVVALGSPGDATARGPAVVESAGGITLGMPVRLPSSGLDGPSAVMLASITTADDTLADVLVTHDADQALWEGLGAGAFGSPVTLSAPGRVDVTQILGGPAPDLVTMERSPENRVRVFEGDGRGGFTLRKTFDSIYNGSDITAGAFYGASGTDIVVSGTDSSGFNAGLYVMRWNDATTSHDNPIFVPFTDLSLPNGDMAFLESADLDGSGGPEIIAVSSGGDAFILHASGTSFVTDPGGILFGGSPRAVVVRDLTGDSLLDIAIADANSIRVREGQGGDAFGTLISLPSNIANDGLAAVDLDADGLPELVAVSKTTADLTVFCNASTGSLRLRVGRPAPGDVLSWGSQGTSTFQIASGTINGLFANGNLSDATCLTTPVGTSFDDVRPLPAPAAPTMRSGYWYLLKCAGPECAEPDFGTNSLREPRFGPASRGAVPDPCP